MSFSKHFITNGKTCISSNSTKFELDIIICTVLCMFVNYECTALAVNDRYIRLNISERAQRNIALYHQLN